METPSQGRGIHEFDNMNFSDESVISKLILHRREIDKYIDIRNSENFNPFEAGEIPIFYEMLDIMYIDLDKIIEESHLTNRQRLLIDRLMYGYNFQDIRDLYGEDVATNTRIFRSCVKRLKEQYDQDWEFGLQWYKKRTNVNWKQCSKCKEWLPCSNEYFSPKKDGKDGFQAFCKECNAKRMRK